MYESINLSEIKVMKHIYIIYPTVTDFFVNDFKSIPKNNKARDKDLENYIFQIFIKIGSSLIQLLYVYLDYEHR